MITISHPTVGDPNDPDWQEAKRLVAGLLAGRIGGDDAIIASYEDLLRWAVQDRAAELAIPRLLNLTEAAIRFAEAGIALSSRYAKGDEVHIAPSSEPADVLHLLSKAIDDESRPGKPFTIYP